MRYIRQYNQAPRTVKWKYADPSRHIGTESVVTGHQSQHGLAKSGFSLRAHYHS